MQSMNPECGQIKMLTAMLDLHFYFHLLRQNLSGHQILVFCFKYSKFNTFKSFDLIAQLCYLQHPIMSLKYTFNFYIFTCFCHIQCANNKMF